MSTRIIFLLLTAILVGVACNDTPTRGDDTNTGYDTNTGSALPSNTDVAGTNGTGSAIPTGTSTGTGTGSGTPSHTGSAVPTDTGSQDTGSQDTGSQDTGSQDTGSQDTGNQDTGSQDTGSQDTGSQDTGSQDTGSQDTGSQDTGSQDTGSQDTGSQDTGSQDTGSQDTGSEDTGSEDTGSEDTGQDTGQDTGNSGDCPASSLVGWATESGGTTGGEGGDTVTVSDGGDLKSALSGDGKKIVEFSGTISASIGIGSNKTLRGTSKDATIKGNINMSGSKNVILQNFHLDAGGKEDGIQLTNGCTHIWADHLSISDASDGNFDIKRESDYITVSWTKFFYTRGGGHRYSNLIGHSDNTGYDEGKLKVTLHHNWWADGVQERMPRVRYGKVHVLNNYFSSKAGSYCVRAAHASDVLIENNYFHGVKDPHKIDLENGAPAKVTAKGNEYDGTSGKKDTKGTAFTPPYSYSADNAAGIKDLVQKCAGPQ